jgi:3-hydroxybutyryl-CoA dehydrogenase
MDANSIQEVAVLGLGTMGHGIAQTFALAGCRVRGYDASVSARETLHDRIRDNLRSASHAGLVTESQVADTLPRIETYDTEAAALEGAQFVVEAVAEDLAVKQGLFERIEAMVDDETILASNSSSHPISSSGSRTRLPQRAVVTHWFNPPHIIPTVEIVGGPETSEETIVTAVALHRRIGKLAVRVNKELPGFLVNRVQIAMIREVWDLLEQGVASAEDIDTALRGSIGFRMAAVGPLEVCDFAGLDIWHRVFGNLVGEIRSDEQIPSTIDGLVSEGNFGAKTGVGFYDYKGDTLDKKRDARDATLLGLARLMAERAAAQES